MNSTSWSLYRNTCFIPGLVNLLVKIPSKNLEDLKDPYQTNVFFLLHDEPYLHVCLLQSCCLQLAFFHRNPKMLTEVSYLSWTFSHPCDDVTRWCYTTSYIVVTFYVGSRSPRRDLLMQEHEAWRQKASFHSKNPKKVYKQRSGIL